MPARSVRTGQNLAEEGSGVKGRATLGGVDGALTAPARPSSALAKGAWPAILVSMQGTTKSREPSQRARQLSFFPDQTVTEEEARKLLRQGSPAERAWVVSHLLRYAQWDDIWLYVSREEVREMFPTLDLPQNLRQAWARMLKVEIAVAHP
jgi:hypothetical protein